MKASVFPMRAAVLCWVLLYAHAGVHPAEAQLADGGAAAAPAEVTTVIVVRHAEKADDSADPALSAAGVARAAALAEALQDADVRAIYTTQFQRTRSTAEPLGKRLGIQPTVVQAGGPMGDHARAFAERVLAEAAGRTVLIVGHSNTVPAIVQALGGPHVGGIADDEYANMFVLLIRPDGVRLIRTRY